MSNPQIGNSINNTEQNTFSVVPVFSQLTQTIGENIAPTFTQGSGNNYFGVLNDASFAFSGTASATIPSAIAGAIKPTFTPSSSAGTLTIGSAVGLYSAPVCTPGSGGAVTKAYSLAVETPTGATTNYTAYLGSTNSALVGLGTTTPHQTLSVIGGISYSVTTVTTPTYTVLNTDNTLEVNYAGAVTLTLPAASASNRGQTFLVKDASGKAEANPITMITLSGTIDGATSQIISVNYGYLIVFSNGTNYYLSDTKLGSLIVTVTKVTTPTFTALDTNTILAVNFAGAVSLALPAASASNNGQVFFVKDASGAAQINPITVSTGGGTIDGVTSKVIGVNYGFLQVYSDGSNYYSAQLNLSPRKGISWINVSGTSQQMIYNLGYYTTNVNRTTLTLPLTAPAGSVIAVLAAGTSGSGLWTIAQNIGQQIGLGNATTTLGTAGSLAANSSGDSVHLLCTVANTFFQVLDSVGNLTIT